MQISYHLNINELTDEFIFILKKQFNSGFLDIIISEINDADFLPSEIRNKKIIDESTIKMLESMV